MDTTDPEIIFDENGICNHCKTVDSFYRTLPSIESREEKLRLLLETIKKQRTGKYDCIVGVSGGLDSTYVIHYLVEKGINPLAVHVDNGWNTEVSNSNLQKVIKKLNIDLITVVLKWDLFRDLQLSFLKASVPDLEIPTDHSLRAVISDTAKKNGLKYIFRGTNFNTESILPRAWSRSQSDWLLIKSIYKKFGTGLKLSHYPHSSLWDFLFEGFSGFVKVSLLDNINYNKSEAIKEMSERYDWKYYGSKHYESVYTRFFQGYILPKKFGIDKRRAHLSSLICSEEMTREKALEEISKAPYLDEKILKEDINLFKAKLGLTDKEFDSLMSLPNKSTSSYPNYENTFPYRYFYSFYRNLTVKKNKKRAIL